MDTITFDTLKVSPDTFLDKVKKDLSLGVKIDSSNIEHTQLTKVWTDSEGWQFIIIGLSNLALSEELTAVEIQSTGQSKMFLRMKIKITDSAPEIKFQKLALAFAQVEEVTPTEAVEFLDAYLKSTFNRTLTSELFDELAHDKNYFNWLSY